MWGRPCPVIRNRVPCRVPGGILTFIDFPSRVGTDKVVPRTASVKLINPNNYEQTYKISLVTIRMDQYGTRTEAGNPTEAELSVQSMIRFSPRRATIPANGWQTVRLMVRKPRDLPDGEYRTQLKVEPLPMEKTSARQSGSDRISINIDVVFHVSIPVIIRHGQTRAAVTPHAPRLVNRDGRPFLETRIKREGNASVYADVKALLNPESEGGSRTLVGEIKGISIYSQNSEQIVYLPVKNPEALTRGPVDIEITSREKKEAPIIGNGRFDVRFD